MGRGYERGGGGRGRISVMDLNDKKRKKEIEDGQGIGRILRSKPDDSSQVELLDKGEVDLCRLTYRDKSGLSRASDEARSKLVQEQLQRNMGRRTKKKGLNLIDRGHPRRDRS